MNNLFIAQYIHDLKQVGPDIEICKYLLTLPAQLLISILCK
jgi:hypothetical protein